MYSQNNEEEIILKYFGEKTGTLLDIGANDGITFSNSYALINKGWKAVLIEPSKTCQEKILTLHKDNINVRLISAAIGEKTGKIKLHESGSLLNQNDHSLVSTIVEAEKKRWEPINMSWDEIEVDVYSFEDIMKAVPYRYEFITIDAEGMDYQILKQINLKDIGCELICVEYNGIELNKYISYIEQFGHKVLSVNPENLIMAI